MQYILSILTLFKKKHKKYVKYSTFIEKTTLFICTYRNVNKKEQIYTCKIKKT